MSCAFVPCITNATWLTPGYSHAKAPALKLTFALHASFLCGLSGLVFLPTQVRVQ